MKHVESRALKAKIHEALCQGMYSVKLSKLLRGFSADEAEAVCIVQCCKKNNWEFNIAILSNNKYRIKILLKPHDYSR